MHLRFFPETLGTAVSLFAAVFLSTTIAAGAPAEPAEGIEAVCHVTPGVLDVGRPAGPLAVRIEMLSPPGDGPAPSPEEIRPGVHVSSVAGVRVPAPSSEVEGIDEHAAARTIEDRADLRRRTPLPNGIPELIVRFEYPSDGDPATRGDGDAGDILAMLMGVPDGQAAEVCFAFQAAGTPFECCDTIIVHNRGLRNLPRGLAPSTKR